MNLKATFFFVLAVFCVGFTSSAQAAKAPEFYAEAKGGDVKLLWVIWDWQDEWIGVRVKHRFEGENDWRDVTNSAIIEPGLWEDKDLAPVEPDPTQRLLLEEFRAQRFAEGGRAIPKELFLEILRSGEEKKIRSLRRMITADFNITRLLGFGLVDRQAYLTKPVEYALFAVGLEGHIGNEPIAVQTVSEPQLAPEQLQIQSLTVDRTAKGTKLRWQFPEQTMNSSGIFGFYILRAEEPEPGQEPQFTKLIESKVGSSQASDGLRHFRYTDSTADVAKNYLYAVRPGSIFQTEYEEQTSIEAPKYKPKPAPPKIEGSMKIDRKEGGLVRLSWEIPEEFRSAIRGVGKQRGKTKGDRLLCLIFP